eukprot:CAMPEP_0196158398 /NCGR_PEP_ID=MMETSP0910-20130528/45775_1 /TAXON_ID=49265 /ORGANISM="Thalassiosira rotula, Strain GSO102" /LENGTH=65 /DNA_ID=CAMNT_0041423295 /DNA_START=31 /DNA_END=229 /DNA_ORIENTATION=+
MTATTPAAASAAASAASLSNTNDESKQYKRTSSFINSLAASDNVMPSVRHPAVSSDMGGGTTAGE